MNNENFLVYSKTDCPNCDKAVYLLETHGLAYVKLVMGVDFSLKDLVTMCDSHGAPIPKSAPQIFSQDVYGNTTWIGGYSDLERLLNSR